MASALQIHRVDPYDTAEYDTWWHAYDAAKRTDMGADALSWSLEESRAELQQQSTTIERRAYIAVHDGIVVGSGSLALSLKDNLHSAALGVNVPGDFRRAGVGSALLAHIESEAKQAGRRTFHAETTWSASAPADGAGAPGREFARRHGYEVAIGDLQNRLTLPVADAALDELITQAPAAGFEIRSWTGPVPDEYVAEWSVLDALLETEAPTGDLELEARSADVDDFRNDEKLQEAQNRISYGTIAVAPDGHIAAYTQLVHSGDDGNAYQWGTLVRREHRGHRLGLRIKLENLRQMQRHNPQIPRVYTFNAESNEHMLAVNTQLGFEPIARMAELQKKLD